MSPDNWQDAAEHYRNHHRMLEACSACGSQGCEGFEVGQVSLCLSCAGVVREYSAMKHSGQFIVWPNKPISGQGKWERNSSPPSRSIRLRIYHRDDFTCRYCGEAGGDLTIDHVAPTGGNHPDNLATACRSCNSRKHSRTPEEAGMALTDV